MDAEAVQELVDVAADLVTDRPDLFDGLAAGLLEFPVLVPLARDQGQESPQPMVTTTSAASRNSAVQGLGNSLVMSMPISAIAATRPG